MKFALITGAAGLLLVLLLPNAVAAADASEARTPNERAVVAFYNAALNKKDFDAASKYFGPHYIQHNPNAIDDWAGFRQYIDSLRKNYPDAHYSIKQVFGDGDFVILHVLQKLHPGDRGNALADFYRLENGKIIEHWDVKQAVPEHAANANAMF